MTIPHPPRRSAPPGSDMSQRLSLGLSLESETADVVVESILAVQNNCFRRNVVAKSAIRKTCFTGCPELQAWVDPQLMHIAI